MKPLKSTIMTGAVAGALLLSAQAFAAPITVDDVTFATGANFQSSQLVENAVSSGSPELTGFGQITAINGKTDFCSECQLTYVFNGYTAQSFGNGTVDFTGGTVNFYVDHTSSQTYSPYDGHHESSASNGDLWLAVAGHTFDGANAYANRTGTLLSNVSGTPGESNFAGTGVGQLDAVSGMVYNYFNTNTISDNRGGFSDFVFTSDFGSSGCGNTTDRPICGSASLQDFVAVPEPSGLLVLGAGLLGLTFVVRRKQRKF